MKKLGIRLIKIEEADLYQIMEWRMKPEVTNNMYTDPKLNMNLQKKWLQSIKKDNTVRYWMIEIDKEKIGVINLCDIDFKNQRCYWAYYIGNTSFRGRGIATALECNIYDYVFQTMELNKLCCEVFAFNEKVISIHKKFGSEVEGTLKQHIYKNGEFYDIVCMGITKEKWSKIKNTYDYEKIEIES